MIMDLGKVTEATRDQSPFRTALDGNPFVPLIYYQICCEPEEEQ